METSPIARVALTGGIATGKSHCLARFIDLGVPGIDADAVARAVVDTGQPALAAVVARFGAGILRPDGRLDRDALGRIVFADAAARRDLEALTHPAVRAEIDRWFSTVDSQGSSFAVAEIPLLYESNRQDQFDRVVVAWCPEALQLERMEQRGLSGVDARQRLGAQLPIADKAKRAHFRIDTSGTIAETDRQVVEVWERLKAEFSVPRGDSSPP